MLSTAPLATKEAKLLEAWLRSHLPHFDGQSVRDDDEYLSHSRKWPLSELRDRGVHTIPKLSSYDFQCAAGAFRLNADGKSQLDNTLAAFGDCVEFGHLSASLTIVDPYGWEHSIGIARFRGETEKFDACYHYPKKRDACDQSAATENQATECWKSLPAHGGWSALPQTPGVPDSISVETSDRDSLCTALQKCLEFFPNCRLVPQVSYGASWPTFVSAMKAQNKTIDIEHDHPNFAMGCQRHQNKLIERLDLTGKVTIEIETFSRIALVDAIANGALDLSRSVIEGIRLDVPLASFLGASRKRRVRRKVDRSGRITYYVKGQTPTELADFFGGSPSPFTESAKRR